MPGIIALRSQFDALPEEVRNHFWKLRELLANAHLEIALAYIFMLLEQGRYRTVKCILVRKLRCPARLVDSMYRDHEFQRRTFQKTVMELVAVDIGAAPYSVLVDAEKVRDKTFHGRRPDNSELRQAIADALTFVAAFGTAIRAQTGKNPFGDLRGLSSRLHMVSTDQARWIIKGVKMSSEAK